MSLNITMITMMITTKTFPSSSRYLSTRHNKNHFSVRRLRGVPTLAQSHHRLCPLRLQLRQRCLYFKTSLWLRYEESLIHHLHLVHLVLLVLLFLPHTRFQQSVLRHHSVPSLQCQSVLQCHSVLQCLKVLQYNRVLQCLTVLQCH